MATYTTKFNLKKPEMADAAVITDINNNMDTVDTNLALCVKNITRSGTTFTATRADGTTFQFTQQDTVYSLPLAANGTRGGVQIGYSQNGKNYPVQLSSEKMFVNVPWTDTTYSDATTSTHGLMSTADKTKLNGIANNANNYSLPLAANGTRGGVQLGYTTSGKNYAVQASSEKLYVNVPWTDTTYSDATTSAHGLMTAADKTKLNGIATGANNYSLPLAANGTRGGVQLGYTTSGKNYAVQQSSEKLYVNVPWTDTVTTVVDNLYTASTTSALSANQGKVLAMKMAYTAGSGTRNTTYTSSGSCSFAKQGCGGYHIVDVVFDFYAVAGKSTDNVAVFFSGLPIPLKNGELHLVIGDSSSFGKFMPLLVDSRGNLLPWYCGTTLASHIYGAFTYIST